MQAGCKCIAITDINGAKLEQTKEQLLAINQDVVVLTAAGDIADERFVNAFINSVVDQTNRLDYAVSVLRGFLWDKWREEWKCFMALIFSRSTSSHDQTRTLRRSVRGPQEAARQRGHRQHRQSTRCCR